MPQVTAMPKIELPELMKILETEAFEKLDEPWAALTISPKRFLMALEQVRSALSDLSELRKASEWVSVEDRLPKPLQPCEAQTDDGDTYVAHLEFADLPESVMREPESFWWSCNLDQEIYHVVRWRHLSTRLPLPASAIEEEKA